MRMNQFNKCLVHKGLGKLEQLTIDFKNKVNFISEMTEFKSSSPLCSENSLARVVS